MLNRKNMFPFSNYYSGKIGSELTVPTEERLTRFCNQYNLNKENFYLVNEFVDPFVYWDGKFLAFSFNMFDEQYLLNLGAKRFPTSKELTSIGYANYFKSIPAHYKNFFLEENIKDFSDKELDEILTEGFSSYMLRDYPLSKIITDRLKKSEFGKSKIKEAFKEDIIKVYMGEKKNIMNFNRHWGTTNVSTAFFSSVDIENKAGDISVGKIKVSDIVYFNEKTGVVYTSEKIHFTKMNLVDFEDKKVEISTFYNRNKEYLKLFDSSSLMEATCAFNEMVLCNFVSKEIKASKEERDGAVLLTLLNHLKIAPNFDFETFSGLIEEKLLSPLKTAYEKHSATSEVISSYAIKINDVAKGIRQADDIADTNLTKLLKIAFCLNLE